MQEGLTNVVRHAGDARATVRVERGPHALTVEVSDDGPGAARLEEGNGIRGMRERAASLGGTVTLAPGPRGGLVLRGGPAARRARPRRSRRERADGGTPDARIRVAVVDDQPLVRMGLRTLINSEDDLELVGEAEDGRAGLDLVRRVRPDVVLMDIRMPRLDGIEALRAVAADPALAGVRVIVLTTFETDEHVFDALQAGAAGFLIKDSEPADMLRAVRLAAAGESLLSPSVTRRVIASFSARGPVHRTHDRLGDLTEREREVLALIGEGLSNHEIGTRLVVSPATARTHVSRVMTKLGARDRAQLVVIAYQSGLVR